MIKNTLSFLFFISVICNCAAQNWQNNLNKAIQEASQQNKKVLLFFSVPEYCDSCFKLEKNIFKSEAFLKFADQNYVLVKIDFSNKSNVESNELMAENLLIVEKYNKDGFFPLVVLLNKDSKVVGKAGVYKNETPEQYLLMLQKINRT
jgi:thioredoxin-related protein